MIFDNKTVGKGRHYLYTLTPKFKFEGNGRKKVKI
jgi:hypothetical protein